MGQLTRLFAVGVATAIASNVASCSRTGISPPPAEGDDRPGKCGNAIVESGEDCDDGNTIPSDACRIDCTPARCGDEIVAAISEVCDDGNAVETDGCRSDCTLSSCGDGVLDPGEECDDGGASNTCTSACRFHVCGDGFLEPLTEECDDGPLNATLPALSLVQDAVARGVRPVVSPSGVATFYSYTSASAHTGFELADASRLYFHQDGTNGALAVVTHHGIDEGGTPQPKAKVQQRFSFLPTQALIAIADDKPEEFFRVSTTVIQGDWGFDNNTDGGAIGALPFPGSWAIHVESTFELGISGWGFIDAGAQVIQLSPSPADLVAYDEAADCRLDCTIPRCGDGELDAGEICDDGNVASGDGCAGDCASMP